MQGMNIFKPLVILKCVISGAITNALMQDATSVSMSKELRQTPKLSSLLMRENITMMSRLLEIVATISLTIMHIVKTNQGFFSEGNRDQTQSLLQLKKKEQITL